MVEAWASGLTWREIMMDSAMDDGDLARLLRRTIDLLAQVYYECRSFYRGKQDLQQLYFFQHKTLMISISINNISFS